MRHNRPYLRTWTPIIADAQADEIEAIVGDIARFLEPIRGGTYTNPAELQLGRMDQQPPAWIGSGVAGTAILHAYRAQALGVPGAIESAAHALESAERQAADTAIQPGLLTGITGVAWCISKLRGVYPNGELSTKESKDPLADFDLMLLDALSHDSLPMSHDLLSGLAGIGVYALARLPRPTALECIRRLIAHLDKSRVSHDSGIYWPWPFGQLEPSGRRRDMLGLAHGNAGVVYFLARCSRLSVAQEVCRSMLDAAVDWIVARHEVFAGTNQDEERVCWCWGNLGVACSLYCAGMAAGREDWMEFALSLARGEAARPIDPQERWDACLCHGAAGNGHLFNRIYQASGDAVLADAAMRWFRHALHLRGKAGIGGFKFRRVRANGVVEWVPDASLLFGSAGVALCLLAAISHVPPAWDEILGISLP